jgi:hypothetical protein
VLYASQPGGSLYLQAYDANNLYFIDLASSGVTNLVEVAVNGASPASVMYTFTPPSASSQNAMYIAGSNGSQVVFTVSTANSEQLESLPVGATPATASPTVIASINNNGQFLNPSVQGSQVYVGVEAITPSSSGGAATYAFSEEVLNLDGTVVTTQANTALIYTIFDSGSSVNLGSGYYPYSLSNLLLVQGITATDGSYTGGTYYDASPSGTSVPMLQPNGQSAVIPAGDAAAAYNPYSTQFAVGEYTPPGSFQSNGKFIFDFYNNQLVNLPAL